MAWNVELTKTAENQLRKLEKKWQITILDYFEDDISTLDNPRLRGKALTGDKKDLWRYRLGDYRIICDIRDEQLVLLAVTIGYRKDVYI